jgi:hypothetical protein
MHLLSWFPLLEDGTVMHFIRGAKLNMHALPPAEGHFENHVFVFGCLLSVVSQTLVRYFDDVAIAHVGYFGTDFKISDRDSRVLLLYARTIADSSCGHCIQGRNKTDFPLRTWQQE